jgi:hypothetical protein
MVQCLKNVTQIEKVTSLKLRVRAYLEELFFEGQK